MSTSKIVTPTTVGTSSGTTRWMSSQTIANSMNWIPNQTNGISRGWTRGTGDRPSGRVSMESSYPQHAANGSAGRGVDTQKGTAQTGSTMKSARTTSSTVLVLIH